MLMIFRTYMYACSQARSWARWVVEVMAGRKTRLLQARQHRKQVATKQIVVWYKHWYVATTFIIIRFIFVFFFVLAFGCRSTILLLSHLK